MREDDPRRDVQAAEMHERHRGMDDYDERPDLAEAEKGPPVDRETLRWWYAAWLKEGA